MTRQPFDLTEKAKAASTLGVPRNDFDMGPEEQTLASEAMAIFRRDFAANCAAVRGGDNHSSKYLPGRVIAHVIEGLPNIFLPSDLLLLLGGLGWRELPNVAYATKIQNSLISGKRLIRCSGLCLNFASF